MKYQLICYPNCSTCRKAKDWLKEQGVEFDERNIAEDTPKEDDLTKWIQMSDKPLSKFFNASGKRYRELDVKSKLIFLSDEELIALLASDGMLIKRPLLIGENLILVAFKELEWAKALSTS